MRRLNTPPSTQPAAPMPITANAGPDGEHAGARYLKGAPLNHVGVQVDDLDTIEMRVKAVGLVPFSHGDYEPGRRFYFLDPDGIEYEVVSYSEPRRR